MSSIERHEFPGPDPFLSLQRNSIIRTFPSKYIKENSDRPLLFKKPSSICVDTDEALPLMWKYRNSFSQDWRKSIARYINSCELEICEIEDCDTPAITDFFEKRYLPEMASEICSFDLFRFRNYGHGLILKDKEGKVQGTVFEIGYDTPEKTSFTIRLAISEELKGKNLGCHLMQYSCLHALEQGSQVKRGIIQFNNLASLHINLNKVGWICDRFEPYINGLGAFFHIALPLDPMGLTGNIIDFDNCKAFVNASRPGIDFRLLDCKDFTGVWEMYRATDFKVVALMKGGLVSEKPSFLAIPATALQMDSPFGL